MKDQCARCDIDDGVRELHARGRLQDSTLREHLGEAGLAQVSGCRAYLADLKQALRDLERSRGKRHTGEVGTRPY